MAVGLCLVRVPAAALGEPTHRRMVAFTLTKPSLWRMRLYRSILPEAGAELGLNKAGSSQEVFPCVNPIWGG